MLRRSLFALALVAAVPAVRVTGDDPKPAASPAFWTEDELRLVDRGLEVVNCDRKDLAFQKRPIDDPFRLPIVNRVLDDPLSIGPITEAWDVDARKGSVGALLMHARWALDLVPKTSSTKDTEGEVDVAGLPEALRGPMVFFLAALDDASDVGAKIRVSLGPDAEAVLRRALKTQADPSAR